MTLQDVPRAGCGRFDSHGAHRTTARPYWCAGNRGILVAEEPAQFGCANCGAGAPLPEKRGWLCFDCQGSRRSRSAQVKAVMDSYGVTNERDLKRAIRDEYAEETGERFTLRDAELMLDGMYEAEYQRLEGGAYE